MNDPRNLSGTRLPGFHLGAAAAVLGLQVAAPPAALSQPPVQRVEHAIEVPPEALVTVMNFSGSVEVRGAEDRILRVVGVKRITEELPEEVANQWFASVDLAPERRGRRVHIGSRASAPSGGDGSPPELPVSAIPVPDQIPPVSVNLELWLPVGCSVEVRTFSAPILATRVDAPEGSFRLRSVSGAVTVNRIEVNDLRIESVSGTVRLSDAIARRGQFQTLTGVIQAEGGFHPDGWYDFQTHSGPVFLEFEPESSFTLEARTYDAEILNLLPIAGDAGPGRLEVSSGDGGPQLRVNTFDGPIELTVADSLYTTPDR